MKWCWVGRRQCGCHFARTHWSD